VALLSDVWRRDRLVVLGQGVLAASLLFTAWTSSPWGLTLGLALAGASSGVACGSAQALLLTSDREGAARADRAMVRWSLYCSVGDVLTPIVTGTAIGLGHSYRVALGAVAIAVGLQCVLSAALLPRTRATEDAPLDPEPAAVPLRQAVARALRLPRLWLWLLAAASCTLLDELVIALAVLRLAHDRAASAALATAAAVCFSAGAVLGGALTDRVVERLTPRRVLVGSAVVCAAALGGMIASGSLAAGCVALFVVGVTCAPHHPLSMARAYEELPDRPGTVQAMGQLFVVVDVGAPLLLGAIADRFGLGAAIGCLVVQPVVVATVAGLLVSPPTPSTPAPAGSGP
jgi:MFS family permease